MKLSCECEAEYYKDMFDRHNYSVRQILRNLNTICSFKSSQGSKSVFKLLIKRKEVFDHKTICSEFNNYFSTVGELLIQNLQQTTLTGTVSNFQQYANLRLTVGLCSVNQSCAPPPPRRRPHVGVAPAPFS